MRRHLAGLLLLFAGCAAPPAAPPARTADEAALATDLFPFQTAAAAFTNVSDSSPRTLRVEPAADGASAKVFIGAPGGELREILHVTRRDGSLYFAAGPDEGTELLRGGAHPGDSWESGGRHVRFDGWERVALASASYDAARITARRGPTSVEQVETWWFAKNVGLVRLRNDHATFFVDELVRSSP